MLTREEFDSLQVGDAVGIGPLFAGLTDESITLLTRQKDEGRAEFTATYFGVTLGRWVASVKGNDLVWSF